MSGHLHSIKIFFAKWMLKAIYGTCRFHVDGEQQLFDLIAEKKSVIIACWHGRLLMPVMYFANRNYYALAGTHADAELISQIASRIGWQMIRGSSSEGGQDAFKNIVRSLKNSGSVVYITPDGPKGPALEPKSGTIRAAQITNSVILPVGAQSTRHWGFTNWDTFFVAKPFSKIEMVIGEPISFTRDDDEENAKDQLKTALDQLSDKVDDRVQS
ncbi:MAG: lysophospholipid acyltransferase family protein [Candidatus Marinimicrobia bacterium]|nr:lysophospholipid acyltransferase family protein [Candidatus Neomarinimicrobiota bacterium]